VLNNISVFGRASIVAGDELGILEGRLVRIKVGISVGYDVGMSEGTLVGIDVGTDVAIRILVVGVDVGKLNLLATQ
jgi:hypothetical protein